MVDPKRPLPYPEINLEEVRARRWQEKTPLTPLTPCEARSVAAV